ncbi:MAG: tRNA nucleotidyltransferase, partial [Prevotella sp.]|nr:tRNA nucleotidyltransferase [Prevotella sp.]
MRYFSNADLAKILNKDIFLNISEVADSLGVECYVIGGYVRDLFLERENKDIDVVVIGSGIQVAEGLKKKLGRKAHVSTFRNFGTAQVKYKTISETNPKEKEEVIVEFVGARKESYNHNSRKPVVEEGTLEDDQKRRDFTINALAICLNKSRFGELL